MREWVQIRVTADRKARWSCAAENLGQSLSDWCRLALDRAAMSVTLAPQVCGVSVAPSGAAAPSIPEPVRSQKVFAEPGSLLKKVDRP